MKEAAKLVYKCAEVLDNKKAKDIKIFDITKLTTIADYFILCSGNSTTQVKTLADEVEEKLGMEGYPLLHKEGHDTARWILMDYGSAVVHIFHHEDRDFYNLEHIWSEAETVIFNG